jgi:hypothetical protein
MTVAITALAVLGYFEEAVVEGPKVLAFINSEVTAIEASGMTGEQKLDAVLNNLGAFVEGVLPNEATAIEGFMTAAEAFINAIVALYNEANGLFSAIKSIKL